MKKISSVATNRNENFEEPQLTIGLDLGDRTSHCCILNEDSGAQLADDTEWNAPGLQ